METLIDKFLNKSIKNIKLEYNILFLNEKETLEVSFCDIENLFTLNNVYNGYCDKLTIDEFCDFLKREDVSIFELNDYIVYN